jgi:hypothetical protein
MFFLFVKKKGAWMMPKIDELLHEHSLHSVRSDGSQMIVLETGQGKTDPEWEILHVRKDGSVENDGTLILDSGEKTVLRKICDNERLKKIAALHDFVEWRSSVLEDHPNEQVLTLQEQLQHTEHDLQEIKTQYETTNEQLQEALKQVQDLNKLNSSQRKKERAAPRIDIDELEQRLKSTASAIAERTPSETQKIIANQVELGAGFYQQVGVQSHESFHLSLWLAAAGAGIFFLTVLATVLVTLLRGDSILVTIIGSIAAALTEGLAASNRLYNQASQQFSNFQVDLDRINRSSICYAMISEEAFEKKAPKQQEAIVKIIDTLLQAS